MFDRFDNHAKHALTLARMAAQRIEHETIGTEHILVGVIRAGDGVVASVLRDLDVFWQRVVQEVEKIVKPDTHISRMGQLPFTPHGMSVLDLAIKEAQDLGHKFIGTAHLFLGLAGESKGVAAQVLIKLGVRSEDARQQIMNHLRKP